MGFPRARAITLTLFAGCLTFAFQNCSKNTFGNKGTQESLKNSGGNYDGKVWVLIDPVNPCADGSHIVTQITEKPAAYILDRDQCTTIPGGRVLADSEVTRDPQQPSTIVYDNQALVQAPQTAPKMKCASTGQNPAVRINALVNSLQSGELQGLFDVIDLQSQIGSHFTEVIQASSSPISDISVLYGADAANRFTISARDRNGLAQITWQSQSGTSLKDDVICEMY